MTDKHQDEQRIGQELGPAKAIAEIAVPVLADLGFDLIRVRLTGQNGSTVQVMAERRDGTMTINDCVLVSKAIAPVLEVEDLMPGSYHLEVTSPGIDRPLVRPRDFERWSGHEARIEMRELLAGRKRFKGRLDGYENNEVRLLVELEPGNRAVIGLPFDGIAEARLLASRELPGVRRNPKEKQPLG